MEARGKGKAWPGVWTRLSRRLGRAGRDRRVRGLRARLRMLERYRSLAHAMGRKRVEARLEELIRATRRAMRRPCRRPGPGAGRLTAGIALLAVLAAVTVGLWLGRAPREGALASVPRDVERPEPAARRSPAPVPETPAARPERRERQGGDAVDAMIRR